MLFRFVLCVSLAACPVLADSLTTQPSHTLAEVSEQMRAIERRVADDLSKNDSYAQLKTQQADLSTQLATCDSAERVAIAAKKFDVTQQITAMEQAELAKDQQYAALKDERDRLAGEAAAERATNAPPVISTARAGDSMGVTATTTNKNHYARLRVGAHKSSVSGVQTFTPQH